MKHHIDQADPEPTVKFTTVFERKYIQKGITSPRESRKRQIMPVALKSMLCLLNDAKSYASTEDNSLTTYIEVRFDKRNVFNHGSCIRIQYNAIQYNTSLLCNALSFRCGVT